MKIRVALFAGLLLFAAGCPSREVSEVKPAPQQTEYKDIPVNINRNVDILFVVDNSNSMDAEQASLAENFNKFISVLEQIEGGLPNVHLGVVSSDVGIGEYSAGTCSGAGNDGILNNQDLSESGCNLPMDGDRFLSDTYIEGCEDPENHPTQCRDRNYDGDLDEAFGCIARLGVKGCGFEQHLESMKRALSPGKNPGFLREDAYLAVVIIADEDDCSAANPDRLYAPDDPVLGDRDSYRCFRWGVTCDDQEPITSVAETPASYELCEPRSDTEAYTRNVTEYADFLKSLKTDPRKVIVASIAGELQHLKDKPEPYNVIEGVNDNGDPIITIANSCCAYCDGRPDDGARPGLRIFNFLEQFPNRNTFTSVCQKDLSDALTQIAELLTLVIGNPCIQENIAGDTDSSTPGIQVDCQVADVVDVDGDEPESEPPVETPLPRCTMVDNETVASNTAAPCWYVKEDLKQCGDTPSKLILDVFREQDAVDGTHVIANCDVTNTPTP